MLEQNACSFNYSLIRYCLIFAVEISQVFLRKCDYFQQSKVLEKYCSGIFTKTLVSE